MTRRMTAKQLADALGAHYVVPDVWIEDGEDYGKRKEEERPAGGAGALPGGGSGA